MAHPYATQFVSITGSGPGAGKSTLAGRIHEALRNDGADMRIVQENWFFEWPDYAELANRFRERRCPSSDDLVAAFDRLHASLERDALWLQDWSWISLAEDLPWAEQDEAALARFSATLAERAATLRPVILYLEVDPAVAVRRAALQRGAGWFKRPTADVVRDHVAGAPRLLRAIAAGSWTVHRLDATRSADDVEHQALGVLRGASTQAGPGGDISRCILMS